MNPSEKPTVILPKYCQSPLRLLIIIAVTIFFAETIVMIHLRLMFHSSRMMEALMDSSLLVVVISPVLYFFLFRPLLLHIRERQRVEGRLNYLAYYDDLTGLANGTLFYDRLSQVLALGKRDEHLIAVLFLDLDRLKLINDSLGRHIGDLLIKAVGERFVSNVRASDSVARFGEEPSAETVARIGGDEFIVLLPKIAKAENAAEVATRMIDRLSEPFILEGHQLFITGSIGISVYPTDGDSKETLVRNSAAAMYSAKQLGGNTFQFYSSDINAKSFERLKIETELHLALEREQFLLHYQPQVDLETGQIIGMEALLRWEHPDRGLVSPAQFIPLAEETGLIIPIGKWGLRTACAQNKAWQAAGIPPINMAVNLSARQFQDKDLVDMVGKVVEETRLDPRLLELEMTESIMQNAEKAITILDKFRSMGVEISLDDFGTGYSSLSYLQRFPIQKLKIDQSFVRNCSTNSDDAAIVSAIITLAHTLKLKVIAEGVETEEQLEFLRSRNCNEMQGYLFSKPLQASDATKLLTEKKRLVKRHS